VDESPSQLLADLRSPDPQTRNPAYEAVMAATDVPVGWAYEAWADLVSDLAHRDNHVRAIAAQVLCNLAKSDPDGRIVGDFPALLELTKDSRFVTARHCLQSLWKVGALGGAALETYRAGMVHRFAECRTEKNWSLIRYDIVRSLKDTAAALDDALGADELRATALQLIDSEDDVKYRKKYAGGWRATAATRART
jgi:hypothetical protein